MASEMNLLARQLNRISEGNRWTRDFTLYALRSALIEVIACFPVYRPYIEEPGHVDDRDRNYILDAVACAKRRNPTENASIYEFIADILLQKFAAYVEEGERPAQHAFALKLQQVLGPVMAKGLEDTAFYVYNRLVSLNEVGGEPQHFGSTEAAFHEQKSLRTRLQEYMFKAAKEAKVNTSWIQEDQRWEEALRGFVGDLLALPQKHALWKGFLPFARRVAEIGMHNSLSQLVLKLASPGVP